jgi:hypothetical protein
MLSPCHSPPSLPAQTCRDKSTRLSVPVLCGFLCRIAPLPCRIEGTQLMCVPSGACILYGVLSVIQQGPDATLCSCSVASVLLLSA